MELRAVIEGLQMLREPCEVVMVTDSQYVKKGMTEWLGLWKARDWRTKGKGAGRSKIVLNQDLWQELDRLSQGHKISWEWVKGHASHPENNRCDPLASWNISPCLLRDCFHLPLRDGSATEQPQTAFEYL